MHYANKYIGKPWVQGEYDCWGLVKDVYANEFGIEAIGTVTKPYNLRDTIELFSLNSNWYANWQKVENPQDGDAVLMRQGKNPCHVGVWCEIDGGGVLHNIEKAGVVFQDLNAIKTSGYSIVGFYRYKKLKI